MAKTKCRCLLLAAPRNVKVDFTVLLVSHEPVPLQHRRTNHARIKTVCNLVHWPLHFHWPLHCLQILASNLYLPTQTGPKTSFNVAQQCESYGFNLTVTTDVVK